METVDIWAESLFARRYSWVHAEVTCSISLTSASPVKLRKDGGADVEGWRPRPSKSGWPSWPSTSWTSWTGGTCECEEFPDHPHIFLFLRILESTQDFGGTYACSDAFLVFFPSLWDFLPQRQSHASSKFLLGLQRGFFVAQSTLVQSGRGSAKFCSSSILDWYLSTLNFFDSFLC